MVLLSNNNQVLKINSDDLTLHVMSKSNQKYRPQPFICGVIFYIKCAQSNLNVVLGGVVVVYHNKQHHTHNKRFPLKCQ